MPVEGATKGATLRPSGNPSLLFVQAEDPNGRLGDEPIYRIMRADEHGRPSIIDHPDPVNVPLFAGQVLDDDPTSVDSQHDGQQAAANPDGIDCSSYRRFSLELEILSAGSPTNIEFFVEFSSDGGNRWAHYAQGLFASLVYSDAAVATLTNEVFTGDVANDLFRLRAVGTGTTAPNNFTFTALVRFWR